MKTLIDYFEAAWVINLPERTDRLNGVLAEFARAGWERGPSRPQVYAAQKFEDRDGFPSVGVRGAYFSHWACLRRAWSEGCRNVLILEDDVALSSALPALTPSITAWLDAHEWDFIYFGHHDTGAIPNAAAKTKVDDLRFIPWTAEITGLHFYAVNKRVLEPLNAHLDRNSSGSKASQEHYPMPVDGAFNIFRFRHPATKTFIAVPKLGWQRPSRSDITPRAFDQFQVMRPLTSVLRKVKYVATRAVQHLK